MSDFDSYAHREGERRRAYAAAFRSDEARVWAASLTPTQRAEAERLGLLEPAFGSAASATACTGSSASPSEAVSLENIPRAITPHTEFRLPDDPIAQPFRKAPTPAESLAEYGLAGLMAADEFRDFLEQDGRPRLRWACLRYLLGEATCEELARGLGMTKQAFHYHVRKLQQQLGLPPMAMQKQEKARRSYALHQKRRCGPKP